MSKFSPGRTARRFAAAVASNAIDIGYADIGALSKAHTRGIEFSIIAPAALWDSRAPVNALMVAKDSPIHNARDLNGKTIAVPGLGTSAAFAVNAWLDANGADLSTIKFIELPYSAMPAALEAGRIDAAHVAEPFVSVAKQHARVLASADDALGKEYLRTVWFSSAAWAKGHPDVVARFAAVMAQTREVGQRQTQSGEERGDSRAAHEDRSVGGCAMVRVRYGERLDPGAPPARTRRERQVRSLHRVPGRRSHLQALSAEHTEAVDRRRDKRFARTQHRARKIRMIRCVRKVLRFECDRAGLPGEELHAGLRRFNGDRAARRGIRQRCRMTKRAVLPVDGEVAIVARLADGTFGAKIA